MVRDDCATKASGAAAAFVVPSMELLPAPPVEVTKPPDNNPSLPIATAATAFAASFVIMKMALGRACWLCEFAGCFRCGAGMARANVRSPLRTSVDGKSIVKSLR
jgi:hypothetical protein